MKRVVLLATMLFIFVIGFTQTENNITDKKLRFGFNLGASYSNLLSKGSFPDNANIHNDFGFKVGLLAEYQISKNIFFSPKSELSINQSSVKFLFSDNSNTTYYIFPASIDIMAHMIYKMANSNKKLYFLIVPNYKIPINKKNESKIVFNTNPDFAIDFGIGIDHKLKYFIFAPELRYSFGLLNVNKNPSLHTLKFNNISLFFNFK